jgi:hypothetical protein
MSAESRCTYPVCGNEFDGTMEFCPVCMLRHALAGGIESGEPFAPVQAMQRFEHSELVMGEDGKPVELGRGAMGVTYKAFDVDLRCPVTLKVIGDKYLGGRNTELSRNRLGFLRIIQAGTNSLVSAIGTFSSRSAFALIESRPVRSRLTRNNTDAPSKA